LARLVVVGLVVVGLVVVGLVVVGLAGFEPATSATQNCYERPARVLALY
jgi:hypothetical protein